MVRPFQEREISKSLLNSGCFVKTIDEGEHILICFLPVLNALAVSFSSPAAVSTGKFYFCPVQFTTMAYEFAFTYGKFLRALWVSGVRCLLGVSINLFVMITTTCPLSKPKSVFDARNFYMAFYNFTMLFGGGLVPYYILVNRLELMNSIWSHDQHQRPADHHRGGGHQAPRPHLPRSHAGPAHRRGAEH